MKQLSASHLDSAQPGIAAVFSLLNKKLLEDTQHYIESHVLFITHIQEKNILLF